MRIRHPQGLWSGLIKLWREKSRIVWPQREWGLCAASHGQFALGVDEAGRREAAGAAQAVGPVSLKCTVTVMMTGVGTPFTSVGV